MKIRVSALYLVLVFVFFANEVIAMDQEGLGLTDQTQATNTTDSVHSPIVGDMDEHKEGGHSISSDPASYPVVTGTTHHARQRIQSTSGSNLEDDPLWDDGYAVSPGSVATPHRHRYQRPTLHLDNGLCHDSDEECCSENSEVYSGSDSDSGAVDELLSKFPAIKLNMQMKYMQLKSFLNKCKIYTQSLSDQKKAIIGMMALAAIVWKREPIKAFFIAIKYYMLFRGLEWGIVRVDRCLSNGRVERHNLLVSPGSQVSEEASRLLRSLPGRNYVLDLSGVEVLTSKQFADLFGEAPYLLAEVVHMTSNGLERDYVDALALHYEIEKVEVGNFWPHRIIRDGDKASSLTVAFPKNSSVQIQEIHYFELPRFESPRFKYIGSLDEMNSDANVSQKLMPVFDILKDQFRREDQEGQSAQL